MLKDEYIEIVVQPKNYQYFKDKGYECICGKSLIIKINDLSTSSHIKVQCICDKYEN